MSAVSSRPRTDGMLRRLARLFGGDEPGFDAQLRQTAAIIGLILLVAAMSFAHAGSAARLVYLAASLIGAWIYARRSPWLVITWAFWLWCVTALARRLIEWPANFNPQDMVLVAPSLPVLVMIPDILMARGLIRRPAIIAGLGVMLPILYGLLNSLARGQVYPGAVSATDWVMPIFYYFYIVTHGDKLDAFEGHMRPFLALNLTFVTAYGLYQFMFMTPWDQYWLDSAGLYDTSTITDPTQNRVFGSFNEEVYLAIWVGWSLIAMGKYFTRVQVVVAPLAVFLMVVTLVRSVYLSTALAFVALVLVSPPKNLLKTGFTAAIGIALMLALFAVLDPGVAERVSDRFVSIGSPSTDISANVRRQIWADTPAQIAAAPFGLGIGAIGRGAVAAGTQYTIIDSGVLGSYLALGWVAGTLYFFSQASMTLLALLGAKRHRSREAAVMAAASLVVLGLTPFSMVIGFSAVLLWVSLAVATERNVQRKLAPAQTIAPGRPGAPSASGLRPRGRASEGTLPA